MRSSRRSRTSATLDLFSNRNDPTLSNLLRARDSGEVREFVLRVRGRVASVVLDTGVPVVSLTMDQGDFALESDRMLCVDREEVLSVRPGSPEGWAKP